MLRRGGEGGGMEAQDLQFFCVCMWNTSYLVSHDFEGRHKRPQYTVLKLGLIFSWMDKQDTFLVFPIPMYYLLYWGIVPFPVPFLLSLFPTLKHVFECDPYIKDEGINTKG